VDIGPEREERWLVIPINNSLFVPSAIAILEKYPAIVSLSADGRRIRAISPLNGGAVSETLARNRNSVSIGARIERGNVNSRDGSAIKFLISYFAFVHPAADPGPVSRLSSVRYSFAIREQVIE
jgi:hypothetical protein